MLIARRQMTSQKNLPEVIPQVSVKKDSKREKIEHQAPINKNQTKHRCLPSVKIGVPVSWIASDLPVRGPRFSADPKRSSFSLLMAESRSPHSSSALSSN